MRRGRMIAAGAVAAVAAGLLVIPAMGNEAPESDPTLMTEETATGAEQPTALAAEEPSPAIATLSWPGAGSAARTADFKLESGAALGKRVAKLDAALPKQGVQKILKYANRDLNPGGKCATDPFDTGGKAKALPPAKKYCFESADAKSKEWIPQAVTGVSDATKDEKWGTERPILIGSYDAINPGRKNGCGAKESDQCQEKGVRITFVDPATKKYRHALLVWPYVDKSKKINFDAVHANEKKGQNGIHIGGMAWYKNYLYVADTYNGIRVFDMSKIMDLDPDNKPSTKDKVAGGYKTDITAKGKNKIGRHGKTWYSFGYRYVMPQVATWTFKAKQYNKAKEKDTKDRNGKVIKKGKKITYCATSGAPKSSYLSIDRSVSPHVLVMGEYCRPTDKHPSTGRLTGYAIDSKSGRLVSGGGVTKTPAWGYYLPAEGIQGAAHHDGVYYLNQSNLHANGKIIRATFDWKRGLVTSGRPVPTAVGPEDLYVEHGKATKKSPLLWSVSEHAPKRVIYAHKIQDILARP
ncbi:hypothetical protein [Streptomyces sp. NPDC000410]|uniref:hypothetical protein n=1 Tax=Streptomyces sp. NPDC000410 TaxID=3154254 RepID=UPI0033346ECC